MLGRFRSSCERSHRTFVEYRHGAIPRRPVLAAWTRPLAQGRTHWFVTSDADWSEYVSCSSFALFHDSRRLNDGLDVGHGARGAQYAATLRDTDFALQD